MSRKHENTGFRCEHCRRDVMPLSKGGYRNHCPFCLYSRHLDVTPGDRISGCEGLMKPVGLRQKPGKGFQIVFKCLQCGILRVNRIAENGVQSDDLGELLKLPPM